MAEVRVFQWPGSGEVEVEVEVEAGLTFEAMVWLLNTTYKDPCLPTLRLSRFTLFSPPHYRVTRMSWSPLVQHAYHGWREKEDKQTFAEEQCLPKDPLCLNCGDVFEDVAVPHSGSCVVCATIHWSKTEETDCTVCEKQSRIMRCTDPGNPPPQILPEPNGENEVDVQPGLSFLEMRRLMCTTYKQAVESKSGITLFSAPHNRLKGYSDKGFFITEFLHPRWVKTEHIQSAASEGELPGAVRCPTCPELFRDSVALGCGHSIEGGLVEKYWGRSEEPPCPGCYEEAHCGSLDLRKRSTSMDWIVTLQKEKVMVEREDDEEMMMSANESNMCREHGDEAGDNKCTPLKNTVNNYRCFYQFL